MNTKRLLFYDNIRNDEIMKMASKIVRGVEAAHAAGQDCEAGCSREEVEDMYYELQRRILAAMPVGDTQGTYWENYIYRLIADPLFRCTARRTPVSHKHPA